MKYYQYKGTQADAKVLSDLFGSVSKTIADICEESYNFAPYRGYFYTKNGKAYLKLIVSDMDGDYKILIFTCGDDVTVNIKPLRAIDLNAIGDMIINIYNVVRGLTSVYADGVMFDIRMFEVTKYYDIAVSDGDFNKKLNTIHLLAHSAADLRTMQIVALKARQGKFADSWWSKEN